MNENLENKSRKVEIPIWEKYMLVYDEAFGGSEPRKIRHSDYPVHRSASKVRHFSDAEKVLIYQ